MPFKKKIFHFSHIQIHFCVFFQFACGQCTFCRLTYTEIHETERKKDNKDLKHKHEDTVVEKETNRRVAERPKTRDIQKKKEDNFFFRRTSEMRSRSERKRGTGAEGDGQMKKKNYNTIPMQKMVISQIYECPISAVKKKKKT